MWTNIIETKDCPSMKKSTDRIYLEEIKRYYDAFDGKCKADKEIGDYYSKRIHPFDN